MNTTITRENNQGRIVLERYELLEPVGRGGFSTVYRARDHKLGRFVAVKVVQRTQELSGRATREAHSAARLSHPHIVTVFELARDEHEVYIVSELAEGPTLRRCLDSGRLCDRDYLVVTLQVLEALEHAHERGVVHRDIKPDNIILAAADPPRAKVTDFGIAQLEDTRRITMQGDIVGTVAYMSPEQAEGLTVDGASDVYSAALTLFECLAGANPFRGATAGETLGRLQSGAPPLASLRPDLPPELSDLLEDALEPDPSLRTGARSFAAGLARLIPSMSDDAQATTVLSRAGRPRPSVYSAVAGRLQPLAARAANAGLSLLVAWAAVYGSGYYPQAWRLPLVLAAALVVGLLPRIGLAALAGVCLLPVVSFSPTLGAILTGVVAVYYLAYGVFQPHTALLPVLAPVLGLAGLGLVFPAAAGLLARLRGIALALIGALALTMHQLLAGSPTLAYVGVDNSFDLKGNLAGEFNPGDVLWALTEPFASQPVLILQAVVWAAAALPAALLIRRWGILVDAAGLALSGAILTGGYYLLPYLVTGYRLDEPALLKTLALCVIIQFGLLIISPGSRDQLTISPRERIKET